MKTKMINVVEGDASRPMVKPETSESSLEAAWKQLKIKWRTKGKVVSVASVGAIGIAGVVFMVTRSGAVATENLPFRPAVTITSTDNVASGGGPVSKVNADKSAVTKNGDATNNADSYHATANGRGGSAQSARTITNNNLGLSNLDWAKLKDLESARPGVVWQTDDRGEYIELPFVPSRQTKITQPISTRPFEGRNRRATVELKNVSSDWQRRFAFQVKSMQPYGDENRQPGNGTAGQPFTILQKQDDDRNYYLAWRVDGVLSREQFAAENGNAVIVIRLLD